MKPTVLTINTDLNKKRKNIPHQTDDYQYYNIRLYNELDSDKLLPAVFSETRTVPILDRPMDYELAVVRFTVPAQLPIFNFPDTKIVNKQEVPIDVLKVMLTFGALQYITSVVYTPAQYQCVGCIYGKGIYNYQYFIDLVNIALAASYTDLKTANPGAAPSKEPFLTYDATTQLFTLNAEQAYETDPVKVYFSQQLYDNYFPSFESVADFTIGNPLFGWVELLIKDNYNNSNTLFGNPYYSTLQEFTTLPLWNDFVSIVFESDTLPIQPELQPSQTNVVRRIITDFEPDGSVNDRQAFQFFPQGALRFYDMTSNYPMRQVDLKVYVKTKDNRDYLLYLTPGQYLTVKIMFRRKKALVIGDILDDNAEES